MIRCLVLLLVTLAAWAAEESGETYQPWPDPVVRTMRQVPVQDGGRVKPLSTAASFLLLRLHGSRELRYAGNKIEPTAWFLDLILRPQLADEQAVFQVEDSAVITAIGLDVGSHDRFDRYSYNELIAARDTLNNQAEQISRRDSKQRTALDNQLLGLASNLRSYEGWRSAWGFVHTRVDPTDNAILAEVYGADEIRFSHLLANIHTIAKRVDLPPDELGPQEQEARGALAKLVPVLDQRGGPGWLAPLGTDHEAWMGTAAVAEVLLRQMPGSDGHRALLMAWEDLADALLRADPQQAGP
ncbi:MAG: hypothetical protein ACYTF0_05520, partial [Planctomycetota bacterium]